MSGMLIFTAETQRAAEEPQSINLCAPLRYLCVSAVKWLFPDTQLSSVPVTWQDSFLRPMRVIYLDGENFIRVNGDADLIIACNT